MEFPEVTAKEVNVEKWIVDNYTEYLGDESFLAPATERTLSVLTKVEGLLKEELKNGILDADVSVPSTIVSHEAGYIDQDKEVIVGVQTDKPLKRGIKPFGGVRIVKNALKAYGYDLDPATEEIFAKYRETHNDYVFSLYTEEMRNCRRSGVITGLPDGYGRGRIIGDYRRIALYGIDKLIELKVADKDLIGEDVMCEEAMRMRHEITLQINALKQMKVMAQKYGFDISKPAETAKEAIQWTYFGYLAAVKEQDGAAMSFGRVDSFLDIYIERDIAAGRITESEAQEMIDDFIIKLRICRHLRTPEYNELFAGDPTWVTMVLGGLVADGSKSLVTKTSYRILQTLFNLNPAPEPNITILWAEKLPENFKKFSAHTSIATSSIQYENDDLMRPIFGDDYAIACCVSAMRVGKDMQFFGARCNMAKLLLYALNGGVDEKSGDQISPNLGKYEGDVIDYESFLPIYQKYMQWMAKAYVKTMNCIHYSHDQACYEAGQMALHDSNVRRFMAFGIAGLSVVADSLSAIKFGKVTCIRDERGLVTDFKTEGSFPTFGNDNDDVDSIASWIISTFMGYLRENQTYRNSIHTLSQLTITSNVVYGKKTGSTPDGRKIGEPFAPGANPMHGRDNSGAIASLNSVAKLPYEDSMDGISLTTSLTPTTLGKEGTERIETLASLLDGYFEKTGHHININVLNRETLLDAVDNPERYPSLVVRVSGYAVNFVRLDKAKQLEVIARTFHDKV